jgi:2-oxoglutarate ferredoxin oxidoreductase subunit alpha
MTETPIVIHLAQRPAPATGLPTRTAQEDLNLALYSGHGEFERIIFAPSTLEDTFTIGQKAFDSAQKYQVPVFILTDQSLLESSYCAKLPQAENIENYFVKSDSDYKRYKLSPVSPMALPGYGEGVVCVDSDEHDEAGYITEDFEIRKIMVEKRLKKLDLIKQDVIEPYFVGDNNFENLIISWGSNFNVLKAAIENRKDFALLHYTQVYPLANNISEYAGKNLIIIEQNAKGQFAQLLKQEYGIEFSHKLFKYNGMPFSIEEIEEFLNGI